MYKCLVFFALSVRSISREIQSIFSSCSTFALGVMIEVTYPKSSLANDSALYPVATRENCPKFEFEFVIEASPPLSASKCLLNPIAKTETI